MRAYNVHIIAKDCGGNDIKFVEVAEYPNRPTDRSGCVTESERERKAIEQVRKCMPHLRNVQAAWSIHV